LVPLSIALPRPSRPRLHPPWSRRSKRLATLLGAYHLSPGGPSTHDQQRRSQALLTLPQLRQLAQLLESAAERTGIGERLSTALTKAGARVRVGEALTVWLLGTVMLAGLGWALAGPAGGGIVVLLALAAPLAALQFATDRRARLFAEQLPDVLKLTASSLRGGFSLLQGLEAVTKQLQEPCAIEFQQVLTEARLGRPVEEALEAAAGRIANPDFAESVAAVRIQQEAGGNLAALFDTLADTMLQRLRLRREIRTLTAEVRLSAYVLGVMPLILAAFLFAVDRAYILELFHTKPGQIALLVALVLQLLGFFWMYRTVKVEL
jgi:tight adherence protein B